MGLYGMMRTSASGMSAQANRLGTVADNIANTSTTGYKHASTEFSTLVMASGGSEFVSGSVETDIRYGISQQGQLRFTTSVTDLAVQGNGFFVVQGTDNQIFLTRAGSFVKDGAGNLVNAAGFTLMGHSLTSGNPTPVANGTSGLVPVNVGGLALQASPSSTGSLFVNLPSSATPVAPANLPSANAASAAYTAKTSLIAYDNLGSPVTLDIYASLVSSNTWEVAVYDRAQAGAGGGFPYSSGPLSTANLLFDGTTGQLTSASASSLTVPVPNGGSLTVDVSGSTQLDASFTVLNAAVDGNAPSEVKEVQVADDGTLYAIYETGARIATYRIPLANVVSPDELQPLAGNVYVPGVDSGDMQLGFAGSGGLGKLVSSALEQSTVDLASELTTMIEAERNYTANSKVFQTGAELMDVLVNLKR